MRNQAPPPLQTLCDGLCALLHVDAPRLEPGAQGLLAFTLKLQDTAVTVLQRNQADEDIAFVVVELGALPPELELAGLRQLMEANLALLGRDAPCFSRHQGSQTILLQWHFTVTTATPEALHAGLLHATALTADWLDLAREGLPRPTAQTAFA